jgi:hypothetical protein
MSRRLALLVAAALVLAAPAAARASAYGDGIRATLGVTAYWPLDETTAPIADVVGNRTATPSSGYSLGLPPGIDAGGTSLALSGTAAANFGNAYNFTADRTIEAWIAPTTTSGDHYVVSKGTTTSGYHLYLASGGIPTFQVNSSRATAPALAAGGWHHLVATLTGRAMALYVDGRPTGNGTVSNTSATSTQSFWLGRLSRSASGHFQGGLDEVALYNRALDAATVAAHFAAGADLSPPQVIFSARPDPVSATSDGSFAFTGSKGGLTFTCALDDDAAAPCAGSYAYDLLRDGPHSLAITATDRWGTTAATTVGWQIALPAAEIAAPVTTLTTTPAKITRSTVASFAFTASKARSVFACRLDGGAWAPCLSGAVTYRGLSEGDHAVEVRATDRYGTVEASPPAFHWTIDITPPRTFLLVEQATATRAGTAVAGSEPGATFECRSANGAWASCPASFPLPDLGSSYGLYVRATDVAGNVQSGEASVVVEPPPSRAISFLGEPASFAAGWFRQAPELLCSLDGATPAACPSPLAYAGLSYGPHTLRVVDPHSTGIEFPTIGWVNALPVPLVAGSQFPALLQLGTRARQAGVARARLPRLLFQSSAPGRARVTLTRGGRTIKRWSARVVEGSNVVTVPRSAWRLLRPGRYGLSVVVTNAAGASAPLHLRFDAVRSTRR